MRKIALPRHAVKSGDYCALLRSCSAVAPRSNLFNVSHKSCVCEPFISEQQHSSRTSTMSDKKQTVDLGLLEEDDEFEEFPAEGE